MPRACKGNKINNKEELKKELKKQILIFNKMKKQIFILVVVLFALGITNSYGQLAPRSIVCLPADALHPVVGTSYTYQIDVPTVPTNGTPWATNSLKYKWFVTQLDLSLATPDDFFINAAGDLRAKNDDGDGAGTYIAAASAGDYDAIATADNIISLSWKSYVYASDKPVFVLIYVTGSTTSSLPGNATLCTTENMKVFKIEPLNAFTLDIDNLKTDGSAHTLGNPATRLNYGDLYEQCIADIASAKYTATGMIYDFGQNQLLYEVNAANWSNSWRLGVQLSGIEEYETVVVEWSSDDAFPAAKTYTMATATAWVSNATVFQYTTNQNVVPSSGTTVGVGGESIFIRVTLDHSVVGKSFQGTVDENIKLAVDGMTLWNASLSPAAFTKGDVNYANTQLNAGPPVTCNPISEDGYTNDFAVQQLKARPKIANSAAPGLPMPNPGLTTVIPIP